MGLPVPVLLPAGAIAPVGERHLNHLRVGQRLVLRSLSCNHRKVGDDRYAYPQLWQDAAVIGPAGPRPAGFTSEVGQTYHAPPIGVLVPLYGCVVPSGVLWVLWASIQ